VADKNGYVGKMASQRGCCGIIIIVVSDMPSRLLDIIKVTLKGHTDSCWCASKGTSESLLLCDFFSLFRLLVNWKKGRKAMSFTGDCCENSLTLVRTFRRDSVVLAWHYPRLMGAFSRRKKMRISPQQPYQKFPIEIQHLFRSCKGLKYM
jgi:hypothetical protein